MYIFCLNMCDITKMLYLTFTFELSIMFCVQKSTTDMTDTFAKTSFGKRFLQAISFHYHSAYINLCTGCLFSEVSLKLNLFFKSLW